MIKFATDEWIKALMGVINKCEAVATLMDDLAATRPRE